MSISSLKISAFRCFEQADIQFSPGINVFSGPNGSGKTSILESVYYLSTGKSFRSPKSKSLIKHGESSFSIFATLNKTNQTEQLAVQLNKQSKKTLKLNHNIVQKQSALAATMPTLCIDPNSYLFCDNSPQFRRSFLDWLVFHVKHDYILIWSQVVRLHQHINHLLKNKQTDELDIWLHQYIQTAKKVNQYRKSVFNQLKETFALLCQELSPTLLSTKLTYYPGWTADLPLEEVIFRDSEKNLIYGQLRNGVHRMDLQLKSYGENIKHIYSRGQKKMTALICYLSCLKVMDMATTSNSILCLDDFDAELDVNNAQHFFSYLESLPNQLLISTVDDSRYKDKKVNMFHVKQF